MIRKAVTEAVEHSGFANPECITALARVKHELCDDAGHRITADIGRMRRLQQLCKMKSR